MAGNRSSSLPGGFTHYVFSKVIFAGICAAVLSATCIWGQTADDSVPPAPSVSQSAPAATPSEQTHIVIPVGTRIPLVLTHPLNSQSIKTGDAVFAQIATPVVVGDQVAVPAGTFVRGKVESLTRRGTRAEVVMRSASLIMGSSLADIGGPVKIESEEWTAWNNPSGKSRAGIILIPMVAMPLGALIGHAADGKTTTNVGGTPFTTQSHKGLVIGTTVGFGVGLGAAFGLMAHSHGFYLEEGTPLDITLSNPVVLTSAQVAEAEHSSAPVQVIRRTRGWPGPGNNPPIGFPGSTPASGPASCSAGQEWCMGSCKSTIDFMNDDNNCGRCGNSCRIGESCTGGSCGCAAGYSSCMGSCVSDSSFISDNNNCGSCGHSCSIGESCTGGMCMKQP
jgi:hypothetical protein